MTATYIPRSDAELIQWLTNYQSQLHQCASMLGLTEAQVKEAQMRAEALRASIAFDEQKRREWQAALAHTAQLKQSTLPWIQRHIEHLRHTEVWSKEYAKRFLAEPKLLSKPKSMETIKPSIRARCEGNKVRVFWTRGFLDGINVYVRKEGELKWRKLDRDTRPPYEDTTPAEHNGEVREYRVVGVINDEEVGQPSDIVTVVVHQ